jgi:probable HAF family extracellular repeat protein
VKKKLPTFITIFGLCSALAFPVGLAAQEQQQQGQKKERTRYKFIDLGTFGGPTNYLSINGAGLPILNNSGIVSSSADTSIPDPNAPNFCSNPDCLISHAYRWQDGVLADIGALPGVNNSYAGAINARGWSVGQSQNGAIDPLSGLPETRAVLWTDRQIVDLGTLGGNWSFSSDLNSRGQVVGAASNAIPDRLSLFFFGTQTRAFLWQNGAMHDLGTLGGPDAAAGFVNERGQVAGVSYTNATPNPVTGRPTIDPFLWDDGRMIDLGTLGGTNGNVGTVVLNSRMYK